MYNYFLWNVFLILGAVSSLAWTSFAIDQADVSDRLSVVLTVILTAGKLALEVSQILLTF